MSFGSHRAGKKDAKLARQRIRGCHHSRHHRYRAIDSHRWGTHRQSQTDGRSNLLSGQSNRHGQHLGNRDGQSVKSIPNQPLRGWKIRKHHPRIQQGCHRNHRRLYLDIESEQMGRRRLEWRRRFGYHPTRLHPYHAIDSG